MGVRPATNVFVILSILYGLFATALNHDLAYSQEAFELCVTIDSNGKVQQYQGRDKVPAELRSVARCMGMVKPKSDLAAPEEIKLEGNLRRQVMNSSLGKINLRWPRATESLFGRTPVRAMADAATTASRALKASSFPTDLQALNMEWQVVFMDENLPEGQIPQMLVTNCHPAWMTPPSNIYVVSQRVAAGCGGERSKSSDVADAELAQVLLHEIGHAVEHQMLKGSDNYRDRMRAEGFATWFEEYASKYSTVIPRGSVDREHQALVKESFKYNPQSFQFQGSAYDYARSSLFFKAIVDRRGVHGLSQVYTRMREKRENFMDAVDSELGWDRKKLEKEVMRFVDPAVKVQ